MPDEINETNNEEQPVEEVYPSEDLPELAEQVDFAEEAAKALSVPKEILDAHGANFTGGEGFRMPGKPETGE